MVVRLPTPASNDTDLLIEVLQERESGTNKKYFESKRTYWQSRIELYNKHKGDPSLLGASQIDEKDKDKFKNLYLNAKVGQCHFKPITNLRKPPIKLLCCPSCGEDGTPRTLDHYLPKNNFPEFSIHLKNLVPMCDICQGEKLEDFLDANGERIFLHPYFDEVNEPILWIKISPPYNAPSSFAIEIKSLTGNADLEQLTQRHAHGLNLNERLIDFCLSKYMHLLKVIAQDRSFEDDVDVKRDIRKFLRIEQQKAINNWCAIFYRSVLEDTALLNYLQCGDLPAFLETD